MVDELLVHWVGYVAAAVLVGVAWLIARWEIVDAAMIALVAVLIVGAVAAEYWRWSIV